MSNQIQAGLGRRKGSLGNIDSEKLKLTSALLIEPGSSVEYTAPSVRSNADKSDLPGWSDPIPGDECDTTCSLAILMVLNMQRQQILQRAGADE